MRNVRNDGTFPGADVGDLLIKRGRIGHVINVGTFLLDQIIYSVHFIEDDRVVGCREEELIDEADPWAPSRYEFRERVVARLPLANKGVVLVPAGSGGEIAKVVQDAAGSIAYHVHFDCLKGRLLQVPEATLDPAA
jgi:nitrogen fixation protein NifZ